MLVPVEHSLGDTEVVERRFRDIIDAANTLQRRAYTFERAPESDVAQNADVAREAALLTHTCV